MVSEILIYGLGAYWISYAVTKTAGVGSIFRWLRTNTHHGGLLDCIHCTGIWVALALVAIVPVGSPLALALSIAGAVSLAHRYTGGDHV